MTRQQHASRWVGLVTAVFACAPAPGAPGPSGSVEAGFARVMEPFPVSDEQGRPYHHPFLGGLNLPRPQLVDIDADGDVDLFVQEYSGELMFFERVGAPGEERFVWRTDRYHDLDIAEWYRFIDLDGDGDVDLLTEQPFSHIRYYRNDGTPQNARFVVGADTLKGADGEPIFSDRQNIPNLTDIDCDGLLDLFIGRVTGTVVRYESVGADSAGTPRFRLVTERFEDIEIVAQIGSRHGANTMAFSDIDLDGDQDLFWGDFFEPGLLWIENTGTCAEPVMRGEPIAFPVAAPLQTSGYNAAAFGDLDADGDDDLLVGVLGGAFNGNTTTTENLHYLERVDDGSYVARTSRLLTAADVGSESIPALIDLDGDTDLDLLLANKIDPNNLRTSLVYRFINHGTPQAPAFRLAGRMEQFEGHYHYAPAFGDLDGDGDLDALLGNWRDRLMFFRNRGTATGPDWVVEDSSLVRLTRGSNTTPALGDIDGDGDLDMFVGEGSGTINFYRNTGTPTQPQFELVSDEYLGLDVGRRSAPALVDLDGDGDLDLVVGTEATGLRLLRNAGTPDSAAFVPDSSWTLPVPPFATPAFADIDADGDLDFFSGGIGGGLVFFENRARR